MVLIMINSWFPPGKSAEIGKKYIEIMKKYPRDKSLYKVVLDVGVRATKDGMNSISMLEVKEGKFKESMEIVSKRQLMLSEIEGYSYETNVFMSGTEAMPLVGLAMPE